MAIFCPFLLFKDFNHSNLLFLIFLKDNTNKIVINTIFIKRYNVEEFKDSF